MKCLRVAVGIMSAALLATAPSADAAMVYGVTSGLIEQRILTFSSDNPGNIANDRLVTGLQPNEQIIGLDIRPTTRFLYGIGRASNVYQIDPTTGAATRIASLHAGGQPFFLFGDEFGIDFNPVADTASMTTPLTTASLRVVSNRGQNLRINVVTGETFVDGPLSYPSMPGVSPSIVAVAYANNFAGAASTTLYGIDNNPSQNQAMGPGVVVQALPPLAGAGSGTFQINGVINSGNPTELTGFDIDADGTVYAVYKQMLDSRNSGLYTLNVSTGAANFINIIGRPTEEELLVIRGIAVGEVVPEPGSLMMLGLGAAALGLRRRRR